MPLVSEISSGTSFERSSEAGTVADRTNRAFRIITDTPGQALDVQVLCGVSIGDPHPSNQNIYCTSFNVTYEGESRLVLLCSFNYQSTAGSNGQDPKQFDPDIRPANWTTGTALIETPIYRWRKRLGPASWDAEQAAVNSAGDQYDGIAQLTGMVNISITQEFSTDPTRHNEWSGYINEETITLGTLKMTPHTVMFRGVQATPYVEKWGNKFFRGWKATYDFAYKKNYTKIAVDKAPQGFGPSTIEEIYVDLGWDIAVPLSGHNVKAFDPKNPGGEDDVFGQPLRHGNSDSDYFGVVIPPAGGGYFLPTDVSAGDRVAAMVKVFSYENGNKGCSQARAASPIPLNPNGRPRAETANPKVIVYGYQVQPHINFTQTFGLRLG